MQWGSSSSAPNQLPPFLAQVTETHTHTHTHTHQTLLTTNMTLKVVTIFHPCREKTGAWQLANVDASHLNFGWNHSILILLHAKAVRYCPCDRTVLLNPGIFISSSVWKLFFWQARRFYCSVQSHDCLFWFFFFQRRSSSSLFCRRPLSAVLAWYCPSSISSADQRCPSSKVPWRERLLWRVTCQNHASCVFIMSVQWA